MNHDHESEQYTVFTVHDPRQEPEQSCIYAGMTARDDIETCVASIFRQKFPDLYGTLREEGQQAQIKVRGRRLEKETASRLRHDLVARYRASGSPVRLGRKGRARPFTIVDEIEAVTGLEF